MNSLNGYRKAAMHIHCLADTDRQWILSCLDKKQQQIINEHIVMLESLSMPKDRAFVQMAIEALDEKSEKALYDVLSRAVLVDPDKVISLFESEPAWTGACLMLEYPSLIESYITPNLDKTKLDEIKKLVGLDTFLLTKKLKFCVFDAVSLRLKVLIPSLNKEFKKLEFDSALERAM